jgi:predicted MFS family arabinose efflux permease
MIGDMFTAAQRAKMQGVFSGVWGVSSVVGPLLGGFLVDQVSWRWIFFINLLPGILAGVIIWVAWRDEPRPATAPRKAIDYAGAGLLTAGVVTLLLGLFEMANPLGWFLLALAGLLLAGLLWVERRAEDPMLPLHLFKDRLFSIACSQGLLSGWALFGSIAFVPLFVQVVLGTSATAAGATLTPMILGWVTASIVGSRIALGMSYRTLVILGTGLLTVGTFMLTQISETTSQIGLTVYLTMMGVGMGFSIPIFLIAIQTSVSRQMLGTATSTLQFSRSIGGALGVNVMGLVFSLGLAKALIGAGLDPATISVDALLDPLQGASHATALANSLGGILAEAMRGTFFVGFIAALLGLVTTLFTPAGQITQLKSQQVTDLQAEPEPQPAPSIGH